MSLAACLLLARSRDVDHLARTMQFPFNWLAQGIVRGALEGVCVVQVEEPVLPEVMAIDAWVRPRPSRAAECEARGLLGRMARRAALYEPFRHGPTAGEYRDCQLKRFALDQHRRKAAEERKRPCPPFPWLWFLCARMPPRWLRREIPRRMNAWPDGFYASATRSGPRLVVIPELPRRRETLLLRMMGAGATLRDALADFRALPDDAPERVVVEPLLVQLQRDLPRMQAITVTLAPEDAEDMMSYEEAVRIWTDTRTRLAQAEQEISQVRKARELAEQQTLQVREQVSMAHEQITRAEHALEHLFERRLRRALADTERDTVRSRFATLGPERLSDVVLDLESDALAAWIADPTAT